MNIEKNKKKLTPKNIYRTLEANILRIRYNWKSIIKRIIIALLPIIPLIILALKFDKIKKIDSFIKTLTLEIMDYKISITHILVYIIIGAIILLILKVIFKPISYQEYNENIKNALTKKESSGDML